MAYIMEHISYIGYLINKALLWWQSKMMAGLGIAFFSFFFDIIHKEAMLALLFLIIFDTFSALLAAYKTGLPVRSARIFHTALKIAVYFSVVSMGFMTEKAVPLPFIDEIIIGFLAVTELISILENAGRAGYAIPTGLLNTLKDFKEKK